MVKTDELVSDNEIKNIKSNPVHLSFKQGLRPIIPYRLKSGYLIRYSIDELSTKSKYEHVSISSCGYESDPAEEELIVKKILGENYEAMGKFFNTKVSHYRKWI